MTVNLSREKRKLKLRAARAIPSWIVWSIFPTIMEKPARTMQEIVSNQGKFCHRMSVEFLTLKKITVRFQHTYINLSSEVRNLDIFSFMSFL